MSYRDLFVYAHLPSGAFVAGTRDGATAYAYPSSYRAEQARKDPEAAAVQMLLAETDCRRSLKIPATFTDPTDASNWNRLLMGLDS